MSPSVTSLYILFCDFSEPLYWSLCRSAPFIYPFLLSIVAILSGWRIQSFCCSDSEIPVQGIIFWRYNNISCLNRSVSLYSTRLIIVKYDMHEVYIHIVPSFLFKNTRLDTFLSHRKVFNVPDFSWKDTPCSHGFIDFCLWLLIINYIYELCEFHYVFVIKMLHYKIPKRPIIVKLIILCYSLF